jgi:hypothetical protein
LHPVAIYTVANETHQFIKSNSLLALELGLDCILVAMDDLGTFIVGKPSLMRALASHNQFILAYYLSNPPIWVTWRQDHPTFFRFILFWLQKAEDILHTSMSSRHLTSPH